MNFDIALLSSWSTRPSIARLIFRAVSSSVTVFMCPSRSAQASFSRFIASTPLMVLKMARGNRLVAHVVTLFTPSCSVDVTKSFLDYEVMHHFSFVVDIGVVLDGFLDYFVLS